MEPILASTSRFFAYHGGYSDALRRYPGNEVSLHLMSWLLMYSSPRLPNDGLATAYIGMQ
jgi:hypothetical protein